MFGFNDKNLIKTPKILLKPQIFDILDLPDGVQETCKSFLSTSLVQKIPKRCHMFSFNDKNLIKTPKTLQNPSFWTFLTFLIILMVSKNPGNTS